MNIYNAISSNKWKTWITWFYFIAFITTLIYVMSKALGLNVLGMTGIALVISGIMSIGSFYYSDKNGFIYNWSKTNHKTRFSQLLQNS